jgi:hypothetical protein
VAEAPREEGLHGQRIQQYRARGAGTAVFLFHAVHLRLVRHVGGRPARRPSEPALTRGAFSLAKGNCAEQ